jgi:hypothetical protein
MRVDVYETNGGELFCMQCDGLNTFTFDNGKPRRYAMDDDVCRYCGAKNKWRRGNDPRTPYVLDYNDRRLLKSMRIAPE